MEQRGVVLQPATILHYTVMPRWAQSHFTAEPEALQVDGAAEGSQDRADRLQRYFSRGEQGLFREDAQAVYLAHSL